MRRFYIILFTIIISIVESRRKLVLFSLFSPLPNNTPTNNNPHATQQHYHHGYIYPPPPPPEIYRQLMETNNSYHHALNEQGSRKKTKLSSVVSSVTPSISRAVKCTAFAFLLSEVLAYMGVFGPNEVPRLEDWLRFAFNRIQSVKVRLQFLMQDVTKSFSDESSILCLVDSCQNRIGSLQSYFINKIIPFVQKYRSLPNKTKFAVGAASGIVLSQGAIKLAKKLIKVVGASYILLESLNYFCVIGGEESLLCKWENANAKALSQNLEGIRIGLQLFLIAVRVRFGKLMDILIDEEVSTSVGLAAGSMLGLFLF